MIHVTATLDPAAFGLIGPGVDFEFDLDLPGAPIDQVLELVFALLNSDEGEMMVEGPGYDEIVAEYRSRLHRSLSVGDTVTLVVDGATTWKYRCTSVGWEFVALQRA